MAMGYEKKNFDTDAEARRFASEMPADSKLYPVVYSKSDTTGEKSYEEFFVEGEKIDIQRFTSLGIIEEVKIRPYAEVEKFLEELQTLFCRADFTKADVVEALKHFLPTFEHEEKGKNLDQKM